MRILGRESALSALLDQALAGIAGLDVARNWPAMAEQALAANPTTAAAVTTGGDSTPNPPTVQAVMRQAIGTALVMRVKEIPSLVEQLVRTVEHPGTPPAMRCALVNTLAQAARPTEFVSDNAPGGYGFIDNAALLQAAVALVLEASGGDTKALEAARQAVHFLHSHVPEPTRAALQAAIQGVAQSYQAMAMLAPELADMATLQLLDHPLAAAPPAGAPGRPPGLGPTPGHWRHGAYFEGNDVVIPGGPALVGGKLFVPG